MSPLHNTAVTADSANSTSTSGQQATSSIWRERIAPSLVALLLGVVLIYATGFATTVELHNAAHDGRHSAGFPCH